MQILSQYSPLVETPFALIPRKVLYSKMTSFWKTTNTTKILRVSINSQDPITHRHELLFLDLERLGVDGHIEKWKFAFGDHLHGLLVSGHFCYSRDAKDFVFVECTPAGGDLDGILKSFFVRVNEI